MRGPAAAAAPRVFVVQQARAGSSLPVAVRAVQGRAAPRTDQLLAHRPVAAPARPHRRLLLRPTRPWQRGSNENTNGLLRHHFPKGTDFATVTEAQLDVVADERNDRPRKRLAFAKPTEEISDLLLR